MEWIIDNWYIAIALCVLIALAVRYISKFLGLPTAEQQTKIKKWLLQAVCEAEAQLGGKTGKLKLSMVYDMFVRQFPLTARVMSFETFSRLVDEALVEMRSLLETNTAVKQIVEGGM